MPKISCTHIFKSYQAGLFRPRKKLALADVTFDVNNNEVFGIIGQNGAGKSTIIKILLGFIRNDMGEATISGFSVSNISSRLSLGYLPENPSLYPNLTIAEHLHFSCRLENLDSETTKTRINKVLADVDLVSNANTKIRYLSKGMTQRAALAYALVLEPKLLVLDEPMSGLDPIGRNLVLDIIAECKNKGATILFCSHILSDVERICDRIAILDHGKLLSITTPQEIKEIHLTNCETASSRTSLESFFLNTILRANQ